MKKFVEVALLCLLLWIWSAFADSISADGAGTQKPTVGPALVRVSVADLSRLEQDAGLRVRSLAGRMQDPGALIAAIRRMPDPAAREAQWSAWLDALAESGELQPGEAEALEALENTAPVVGIPHHEFPFRTMPAFALAARAGALLAKDARLKQARDLAVRPEQLTDALETRVDSATFAAGLEAMDLISDDLLADIVDMHRKRQPDGPANSSMILLKAAALKQEHWSLLPEIVRRSDVGTARSALLLAADRDVPQLPEIAAAALARGELGGLALTVARQSGMHPDEFCWSLLDDPALGADAARMLAAESGRLVEEISAQISGASGLGQLRMLLALRLRGTAASREMLAELVDAPWLSGQQRREVRSWL